MQNYPQLSVREIHEGLLNAQFSARELTTSAFDMIDALDSKVHASKPMPSMRLSPPVNPSASSLASPSPSRTT